MAATIDTTIRIERPPDVVWGVFSAFERWPEWNPFVKRLLGAPAVGAKITVTIEPPGGKAMDLRPRVLAFEPARELRWRGRLLVPGLFTGEHHFRLAAEGSGTRFDHGERFTGLLVGMVMRRMRTQLVAGFESLNAALKARAEAVS